MDEMTLSKEILCDLLRQTSYYALKRTNFMKISQNAYHF